MAMQADTLQLDGSREHLAVPYSGEKQHTAPGENPSNAGQDECLALFVQDTALTTDQDLERCSSHVNETVTTLAADRDLGPCDSNPWPALVRADNKDTVIAEEPEPFGPHMDDTIKNILGHIRSAWAVYKPIEEQETLSTEERLRLHKELSEKLDEVSTAVLSFADREVDLRQQLESHSSRLSALESKSYFFDDALRHLKQLFGVFYRGYRLVTAKELVADIFRLFLMLYAVLITICALLNALPIKTRWPTRAMMASIMLIFITTLVVYSQLRRHDVSSAQPLVLQSPPILSRSPQPPGVAAPVSAKPTEPSVVSFPLPPFSRGYGYMIAEF